MAKGTTNEKAGSIYSRTLGITIIGYSYFLLGGVGIIFSLVLASLFFQNLINATPSATQTPDEQIFGWIITRVLIGSFIIFFLGLIFGFIFSLLCGWGIVRRKKWSRILGMVFTILNGSYLSYFFIQLNSWIAFGTILSFAIGAFVVLFLHPYEFMTRAMNEEQA